MMYGASLQGRPYCFIEGMKSRVCTLEIIESNKATDRQIWRPAQEKDLMVGDAPL